jgi:putative phosphoribosyl transferase
MIFQDRHDAAMRLIPILEKYKKERGVIMAVPRGGVPIGYLIAKSFHMPLELLMTKKIGHPLSEELAIGSVSLENYILDYRHQVSASYLEKEINRIRQSLHDRFKKFMGDRKPADIRNKIVIIVDDGIATGNTMLAAIKMMRPKMPAKIIVAVPVAPVETAEKISMHADELLCLHVSDDFTGVGQYYENFSEVSDEEVIELLKDANKFVAAA